jgi:hypothetical protein
LLLSPCLLWGGGGGGARRVGHTAKFVCHGGRLRRVGGLVVVVGLWCTGEEARKLFKLAKP